MTLQMTTSLPTLQHHQRNHRRDGQSHLACRLPRLEWLDLAHPVAVKAVPRVLPRLPQAPLEAFLRTPACITSGMRIRQSFHPASRGIGSSTAHRRMLTSLQGSSFARHQSRVGLLTARPPRAPCRPPWMRPWLRPHQPPRFRLPSPAPSLRRRRRRRRVSATAAPPPPPLCLLPSHRRAAAQLWRGADSTVLLQTSRALPRHAYGAKSPPHLAPLTM